LVPPPVIVPTPDPTDPLRGPDLPPPTSDWPDATRRWWWTWRRSAQAVTFTPTDWDFLLDTAVLHARFWNGDEKVAAELRQRVAKFGATPEDRLRLRMQVTAPIAPEAEKPVSRYGHLRAVKEA
jgi:hypothetical protein